MRPGPEQHVADSRNHSLCLVKLFNSSNPEGNSGVSFDICLSQAEFTTCSTHSRNNGRWQVYVSKKTKTQRKTREMPSKVPSSSSLKSPTRTKNNVPSSSSTRHHQTASDHEGLARSRRHRLKLPPECPLKFALQRLRSPSRKSGHVCFTQATFKITRQDDAQEATSFARSSID